MAAKTEAQEEFDHIIAQNSNGSRITNRHPDDSSASDADSSEPDEASRHSRAQLDATLDMPLFERSRSYNLPHTSFDSGCNATGVKGVIADARSYDQARRQQASGWRGKLSRAGDRTSRFLTGGSMPLFEHHVTEPPPMSRDEEDGEDSDGEDDEDFLERWRETRRLELEKGADVRSRRTSPSVRRYGRFDEVDALGYLDAIERVGRETVVVVFVYDHECPVSQLIEQALIPLVSAYPAVHFTKVHYEAIEFDNAGVPAILAYKNQGDLFANLTYVVDQIPEDTHFDSMALTSIMRKHQIL